MLRWLLVLRTRVCGTRLWMVLSTVWSHPGPPAVGSDGEAELPSFPELTIKDALPDPGCRSAYLASLFIACRSWGTYIAFWKDSGCICFVKAAINTKSGDEKG